jgi:proline iminopeptidase
MQFRDVRSRMHLEFSEAASQLAWSTEVFWAMARGGLWELDYLPRAAGCPVPQLVVAGSEDATSYPEQAQELASACSVPLEVVEAGHFPWVEEPEAFLEALAELERSAGEAAD